ncbi:Clavaminate synthase-like protein [Laetiporus sulphureus 93-53]|uniref:Clavaminate synthase-like protein n=1 Tax=Laetiporus sulphureus 93-53 TaxID=1314785 RepID=A0A165I8N2_9APHY|nr:Clavaminate synthase-like protein [Laetiporus sulphureus 93-53]KZT12736.1 Clavaminate synthase-like protein [Laetiporus sulphureus 93-53]
MSTSSRSSPMATAQIDTLKLISKEYHDFNGSHYDILHRSSTPLGFSRLVHISRPVLFKSCVVPDATSRWTNEYLVNSMGERSISIAVTPNGRADAITCGKDGRLYFAEPHVESMTMRTFLDKLSAEPKFCKTSAGDSEVYYLQSQNGNLFAARYFDLSGEPDPSVFEPLRRDVPSEISWCTEALGRSPEAVNLWIGNSRSVTSMHSDPYENIYSVVRGAKHFTLLPPTEAWCVKERTYPHARFQRSQATSQLELVPSPPRAPSIRWSSVQDPTSPGALPPEAHPIHITVRAGETLYLPAGWWHYVRQSELTIAINYWYDMESRGMSWVWHNFLRGSGDPPSGNQDDR